MSVLPGDVSNRRHLSFINEPWLHAFGLSRENVLEYFALSMFYDPKSNNQALRTQGAPISALLQMTGIEYALDEQAIPAVRGQLHLAESAALFVIKKQNRYSPHKADLIEVYYVLNGVIYLAPSLMDIVRSRVLKSTVYLKRAMTDLMSEDHYTAAAGHITFISDSKKQLSEKQKPELVSRELPSFKSVFVDIATYIENVS